MTFDLTTIAIFTVAAAVYGVVLPPSWRGWALMLGSAVCVYWLQPALPIRFMDFILPTATLLITVVVWWVVRGDEAAFSPENRIALGMLFAVVVGMSLMRYINVDYRLTPSRPPDTVMVVLTLVILVIFAVMLYQLTRRLPQSTRIALFVGLIIGLFLAFKIEPIGQAISRFARGQTGQDTTLAAVTDLGWLGFSYVAFRLLHTLRDRATGKLPALSLREYMTYVTFFPAFIAGPIDRAERFIKDSRALPGMTWFDAQRLTEGLTRIGVGIFKKFIIADSLALFALSAENADQVVNAGGMWLLLYGYAFRLFFDFSGYSDIAIGIGILFGIKLPENFNRPYLKTDIASFWQSWHITLSNWVRFYVFTPLSRALLMRKPRPSPTFIVFASQLTTMIVIGLWHGVTINFFVWGMWHGAGLFIHKQWSDRTRKWYNGLKDNPAQKRLWSLAAWFITFHFVVLGWVWFALPDFGLAVDVFARLFGAG